MPARTLTPEADAALELFDDLHRGEPDPAELDAAVRSYWDRRWIHAGPQAGGVPHYGPYISAHKRRWLQRATTTVDLGANRYV
jgi:hypothetical protein